MNNKTKATLVGVFSAAAVAIGVTTIVLVNQPTTTKSNNSQQSQVVEQKNDNLVNFEGEAEKSVLDQLKTHATVETKDSSLGAYVDGINGKVGGTDGKYWGYYVDGQMGQVGASEYITKGGELVEWKFE